MAIENLINKGISTFLGGDDKGTGIDRFVSNFDTGARANRFQADFFGPMGLSLEGLRCDTASLPGRTIETTPWSEYGQKRQMPNAVNDGGETAFTFNCDQAFADRLIIEAWQSLVYTAGDISSASVLSLREVLDNLYNTFSNAPKSGNSIPLLVLLSYIDLNRVPTIIEYIITHFCVNVNTYYL